MPEHLAFPMIDHMTALTNDLTITELHTNYHSTDMHRGSK